MPELFSYATPEYVNDLFLQNVYLSWGFIAMQWEVLAHMKDTIWICKGERLC